MMKIELFRQAHHLDGSQSAAMTAPCNAADEDHQRQMCTLSQKPAVCHSTPWAAEMRC